ncbi:unnamed protein product [Dracunculus medinensis]|uniref:Helicase n=1 Tax=Dracunculus medinensis TaxID=318479 RepID=A0A0N4U5N7_DRAME|nr:unnamed protein product [Dracunculus medinensis]
MEKLIDELNSTNVKLRSYQIDGIKKILNWYENNRGGIIADEMGLGKTFQAISILSILINQRKLKPHLIVCPLSIINQWRDEINKFSARKLKVVRYTGNCDERDAIRKKLNETSDWQILLTTFQVFYVLFLTTHMLLIFFIYSAQLFYLEFYSLIFSNSEHKALHGYVLKDAAIFFYKNAWESLVFDEAHRLKSSDSMLHSIIQQLSIKFIILLTGTPIQNNIGELFSLLCLADCKNFSIDHKDAFIMKYGDAKNQQARAELHDIINSYMIRRTKEEVNIDIPNCMQTILYHGINNLQKKLYRAILLKNYEFFDSLECQLNKSSDKYKASLLNVLMQLRKCVAHPYLFSGVEPEPFEEGEHIIEASEKFVILDHLLSILYVEKHRVLIFSQMTRLLDIVQDYLNYRGFSYERLDGSVRDKERFIAIKNFESNSSDSFCFLLSTKAGGIGLNLISADTVIFMDSDFNPQNDVQAASRCHRIGQTKPVKIFRLVAKHTVEEMIYFRANKKLQMANKLMETNSSHTEDKLTAAEITDTVLHGLSHLCEATNKFSISQNDIKKLIGETDANSHWIIPSVQNSYTNNKTENENVDNIYLFEGRDYKKEREVLKEIIESAKNELINHNKPYKSNGFEKQMKISLKKLRKPLAKEQIEAIVQKRYTSLSLPAISSISEESNDIESFDSYGPYFITGDVTKPQRSSSDQFNHFIIAHIIDNSGIFGNGGVFTALRKKNISIVNAYHMASKMKDLSLGDVHLIENISNSRHDSCE